MAGTTSSGNWVDMGNVCTNPRGEYGDSTTYNFLDMVSMDGGSYICLQNETIGVRPERNISNGRWFCSAVPGAANTEFIELANTVAQNAKRAETEANNAAQSKEGAVGALNSANSAAQAAGNAANEAENSKDQAAGYANSANNSAESASKDSTDVKKAVAGFDDHVNAKIDESTTEINRRTEAKAGELENELVSKKTEIVNAATAEIDNTIDSRKTEINDTASEEIIKVIGEGTKQANRVDSEAAEQLSALQAVGGTLESAIERYYALRRTNEIYTVEVLDSDVTQACTVNRLDGLEGLVCEPSTNTYRGRDDVGALDAFRPILCNWTLDDEGNQRIHAIEGMPGFKREGKVNVGTMNMGLYYMKERNAADNGWLHHWSMLPRIAEGYKPLKECVRPDGRVQGWMIHPHCMAIEIDGVPYDSEGGKPVRKKASFSNYAYPRKQGPANGYETDADAAWILALTMIKYATRDLQAYMRGCTSYSSQYTVAAGEANTKRVILKKSEAHYFVVGSCVSIGNPGENTSMDRNNDYMHNIVDSAVITAIEDIDDVNSALILDVESPFTTTTNCKVSTMHWRTGSTNKVLGYDGSPVSNTDGKNICKINEIEILCGGYSVCGNSMNIMEADADGVVTCTMYRTDDARKLTTNLDTIAAEWEVSGVVPVTDNAWKYVMDQEVDFARGCFWPTAYGGGEKTGWADAWHTGTNPSVGTKTGRELLRRGSLYYGGLCGPSFVHAVDALGNAYWFVLATLSPNVVRGEWQADA